MEKYGLLFESIFKRKLADDNTVGYLENVTKEHPYFSVAQFYLLQLSQKGVKGYPAQAKKTAVLFNNNHWLNFQLLEAGYDKEPTVATEPVLQQLAAAEENFSDRSYTEEQIEEPVVVDEEVIEEEPAIVTTYSEPIFEEQKDIPLVEEQQPIEVVEEKTKNNVEGEIAVGETIEDSTTIVVEEIKPIINEEPVVAVVESTPGIIEPVEAINDTPVEEEVKPIVEEVHEPAVLEEIAEPIQVIEEITTAPVQEENKPIKEELSKPIIEAAPEKEQFLFEPLHTTDYFASVGIKLSEEEKSSDKLGKQLKSFTDWLKTMKRVHAEQLVKTTSPAEVVATTNESNIQKLAEKSNQDNDVITEAMAEVLLHQGKEDKAVEILEKLSLLNPSKNAYFASKINQIKEK